MDNEYEDVGRKVLDGHNLNEELEEKLHEKKGKSGAAAAADKLASRATDSLVRPMPPAAPVQVTTSSNKDDCVVASSPPKAVGSDAETDGVTERAAGMNGTSALETKGVAKPAAIEEIVSETNWATGERNEWVTDDNSLEELLGICYKSFSCGSVGLFVPTPFGDYIAFHEGCPHYYLSMESIAASKRDGR